MSWVAVAVGVGGAAIGAYSSSQQASAANKPRTTTTNQTTEQLPYMGNITSPDLIAIINAQRALVNQGPSYINGPQPNRTPTPGAAPGPYGPGGNPGSSNYTGPGSEGLTRGGNEAGGSGRGPGDGGDPTYPGSGDTSYGVNTKGSTQTRVNARGQTVPVRNPTGGAGGARAQAPAGNVGSLGNRSGNSLIEEISRQAAQQGLDAGNDPTMGAANNAVRNILGDSGRAGGTAGGAEQTGFEGYNPLADRLARNLEGQPGDADALLRQFMGNQGGGAAGQGGSGGAVPTNQIWTGNPTGGTGGWDGQGGSGGGPGGAGAVPDTVGGSNSYFAQQVRQLMDQGASGADVQAVIDAQSADINRGLSTNLWGLDAAAQGTGRFGGDAWAGLGNQARHDATDQMGTFASRTRLGELADRRSMQENLLGQVNARDLGAMSDATQRHGIDSASATAGAGNAASAASAKRQQDLQALGMLVGHQEFNTGQLSGLADRSSTDRLSAVGMVPGLEGVNLSGLGAANQSAGNLVGLRQAQIAGGTARAGLNQQAQIYNAGAQQNQINDYLRTIGSIGSMGGSSHTTGTNVVPGAGISPTGAAFQGALGGGLAAYGAYQSGR